MAVYYLGNPIDKRKKLMTSRDGIYLDNDEVLAAYGKKNFYYFVVGKVPLSDFSVLEYLSYTKSLELRRPLRMEEAREMLARTGFDVSLNKRLKKLDPVARKAVRLAAMLRPDTTKICINFDGLQYSRHIFRRMQKLVSNLSDYHVVLSVSDTRYVPKDGAIEWFPDSHPKKSKIRIKREGKRAIRLF